VLSLASQFGMIHRGPLDAQVTAQSSTG